MVENAAVGLLTVLMLLPSDMVRTAIPSLPARVLLSCVCRELSPRRHHNAAGGSCHDGDRWRHADVGDDVWSRSRHVSGVTCHAPCNRCNRNTRG